MDPFLAADGINLVLLEGENLQQDVSMMGAGPSSSFGGQSPQKRKRNQDTWTRTMIGRGLNVMVSTTLTCLIYLLVAGDAMVEDPIFEEVLPVEIGWNSKDKQPMVTESKFELLEDSDTDLIGSSTYFNLKNGASSVLENNEVDADDYEYPDEDEYDYYEFENENENEEYDYDDETATNVIDNYENLTAKFDGMDLPPGVEATVPWWLNPVSAEIPNGKTELSSKIEVKYNLFKRFDTVPDCMDHFYLKNSSKKPSKDLTQRIQQEWKVLEKDLPETIFVRVFEDRLDLLRAAITGPAGTPYHDGLFFFDVYFPPNYPDVPPKVYYHSGGLRLNPNLYNSGKVCLSLLGTWSGSGCEKWSPGKSTTLQVLVSIQGLILNEKPYFNEPGFEKDAGTPTGEKTSLGYNQEVFLLSCKTMLYALRKPPMNFEDLVYGHFHKHGRTILIACLVYLSGGRIGCALPAEVPDVDLSDNCMRTMFQRSLRKLYEDLLMEFTVKEADCDEFLAKKIKQKAAKADAATSESISL